METGRRSEEAAIRRKREHARITAAFYVRRVEILVEKIIGLTIGLIGDRDGIDIHGVLVGGLIYISRRAELRLLIASRIFDDGSANLGLLPFDVSDDCLQALLSITGM
jgi:hypothetical protein